MGQYYLPYVKTGNKIKVFDNKVDGDYNGLKLMEHSYWLNRFVGNVVNELYYNKSRVCWVGDYYDECLGEQPNCDDDELILRIGKRVWSDKAKIEESHANNSVSLDHLILVNHTKKIFIVGDNYYHRNKWMETWDNKPFAWCVHPLPLLTCTSSHAGGSYYGINKDLCGTWFYDLLEVVDENDLDDLEEKGYIEFKVEFTEKSY